MEDDPVVRLAGAKQLTAVSKSKHSPKESLLGYRWRILSDTLSTDQGDGMNLFPARRGVWPDWAVLQAQEDLLELHKRQPLCQQPMGPLIRFFLPLGSRSEQVLLQAANSEHRASDQREEEQQDQV